MHPRRYAPGALLLALASLALSAAAPARADEAADLDSDRARMSYSLGWQIGGDFRKSSDALDPDLVARGIRDSMAGGEPALSPDDLRAALVALRQQVMAARKAAVDAMASENLANATAFLEQNRGKDGIEQTESGLQYRVVRAGEGEPPVAEDSVKVHYRGTLVDGTEFDSSYARGEPATFPVNGVIPGWTEALQLMKPGAKWELYIPPALAYGERGAGNRIAPNSALVFEVELLEVAGR